MLITQIPKTIFVVLLMSFIRVKYGYRIWYRIVDIKELYALYNFSAAVYRPTAKSPTKNPNMRVFILVYTLIKKVEEKKGTLSFK